MEKEVKAHEDIVRRIVGMGGQFFSTCSNDQLIKTWDLTGNLISVIPAHNSLIYTLYYKDSMLYSGGEDCYLKLWKQINFVTQIEHPQTIFDITVNQQGQMLTACEDKVVRVFSMDKKLLNPKEAEQLSDEVKKKSTQSIEISKLPNANQMAKYIGKKDQEIRLFQNKGVAEAYTWSESQQMWILIGEAMGEVKPKVKYQGDRIFPEGDYDYVFDVDIGNGVTKKLPYNHGENPLEIGDRFCAREDLGRFYTEQIADFIRHNADMTKPKHEDNKFEEMKDVETLKASSEYEIFKDSVNLEKAFAKIAEFNEQLNGTPSALSARNKIGMESFKKKILDVPNWNMQSFTEIEVEFVEKILEWPTDKIIASMDIMRVLIVHKRSQDIFAVLEKGRKMLISMIRHINTSASQNVVIMTLRALCNMFDGNMSITAVKDHMLAVLQNVSPHCKSTNAPLLKAYLSLLHK